jgi:alkylation response protein AidB-like acyl-CoA dehydrogenase
VAHPLADAWIGAVAAQALTRDAAFAEDVGASDAAARVGAARLAAERAAVRSLRVAHQTFGAQGITLEGPLFHRSRRLRQQILLPPSARAAEDALLAEVLR